MFINVNGLKWEIKFTNNLNELSIDGNIHLGVTDRNNLTVYLSNNLYGYMLNKVLIHELTHVWIYSYGYKLTRQDEEFICSFIDTYSEQIISMRDVVFSNLRPLKSIGGTIIPLKNSMP